MLGLMRRFKKAAVLTDKTWLKKVSEFEGALVVPSAKLTHD